jgi:hypothetical protein
VDEVPVRVPGEQEGGIGLIGGWDVHGANIGLVILNVNVIVSSVGFLYQLALEVTLDRHSIVMVGEGRPSTSFLAAISKDVDSGPSPARTGKAKLASHPMGRWYYCPSCRVAPHAMAKGSVSNRAIEWFDGRHRLPDHAASRMRSAVMPRVRKRWQREMVGMFRLRRERGCRWLRSSS